MNQKDLIALIEDGIERAGGRWADLGAGEGAFTHALAKLLGPEAHITAVDKDAHAVRAIDGRIETRVADFTKPLDLHDLDGIVMANSLHFVRNKQPVLESVRRMLSPGGRLIVVDRVWDGPRKSLGALSLHLCAMGRAGQRRRLQEHSALEDGPEPLARQHVLSRQ
ncbi:MAG TPA: methyltransferase domain-containing protein [Candidatus Dormibacteraeota bacterium]|nr:methyltransferase domain-containing protein [Candidatus Dormibacteraeota bacterium]